MMPGLIALTRAPRLAQRIASPRTLSELRRFDIWSAWSVSPTPFTQSSSSSTTAVP